MYEDVCDSCGELLEDCVCGNSLAAANLERYEQELEEYQEKRRIEWERWQREHYASTQVQDYDW